MNTIYSIKKSVADELSFKRSYTTIFYEKTEEDKLHVGNKYHLASELRVNNSTKENLNCIEKYFSENTNFKQSSIYKIAGVMDYKIIWNNPNC